MSRRRCGVYRCLEPWLPLLLSRGCPYISQRDAPFVSFFVMMEGQEVTQKQSSGCFQGGRSQLVSTVSSAAFPFSCPESPSHSRSLFFFLTNILTVELTEKVVSAAGSCSRLLAAGRRGSPHYVACLSPAAPRGKALPLFRDSKEASRPCSGYSCKFCCLPAKDSWVSAGWSEWGHVTLNGVES